MKYIILTTTAITLLSACGFGGGMGDDFDDGSIDGGTIDGGGDPGGPVRDYDAATPLNSFSESAGQGGTYSAAGIVTSAEVTTNGGKVTWVADPETTPGAQLHIHLEDELLRAVRVSRSGADFTLDEDNGALISGSEDGTRIALLSQDERTGALLADPRGTGFEYQSFGVWDVSQGMVGHGAAGSFGVRTSANALPAAGTASYHGSSVGQVVTEGEIYLTDSRVAVTTDFETVAMTSSDTSIVDMSTGNATTAARPDLDFTASGTLTGSGFTSNIDTAGIEGSVNGQFYGPGAEEVGGTFAAKAGQSTYLGAFGAAK
ncbi:transferrin-binding protein-like solute binding protein [Roseivivax sp. CAU 1761]